MMQLVVRLTNCGEPAVGRVKEGLRIDFASAEFLNWEGDRSVILNGCI